MIKFLAVLFMTALVLPVWAQPFEPKTRPIEIVVPYPPGGATDAWGRVLQRIFTDAGWLSYVSNRPGADTVIGSNYVAASRPDGHVLYVGGNGFLDANLAFRKRPEGIQYRPNDFEPIIPLGAGTAVLTVAGHIPVSDYAGFRSWVRANPDRFVIGFWNEYTANVFREWAKLEQLPTPRIVIYRGSAPQIKDIVGQHIPFVFDTFTAVEPFVKDAKVKIIAILDTRGEQIVRRAYPHKTLFNIGGTYPHLDVPIWYGLYAPSGIPPDTVKAINSVLNRYLSDPKYSQVITDKHILGFGGTPAQQQALQQRILEGMRRVAASIE